MTRNKKQTDQIDQTCAHCGHSLTDHNNPNNAACSGCVKAKKPACVTFVHGEQKRVISKTQLQKARSHRNGKVKELTPTEIKQVQTKLTPAKIETPTPRTVGELAVGQRFVNWDGQIGTIKMNNGMRVKTTLGDKALGCEILEALPPKAEGIGNERDEDIMSQGTAKIVAEMREKQASKTKLEKPVKAKKEVKKSGNVKLFDHRITSVLRWMGKNDFTFDQAKYCLTELKVGELPFGEGTIGWQLSAGKHGKKGAPAKLTGEQVSQLKGLAKKAPVEEKPADKKPVKTAPKKVVKQTKKPEPKKPAPKKDKPKVNVKHPLAKQLEKLFSPSN